MGTDQTHESSVVPFPRERAQSSDTNDFSAALLRAESNLRAAAATLHQYRHNRAADTENFAWHVIRWRWWLSTFLRAGPYMVAALLNDLAWLIRFGLVAAGVLALHVFLPAQVPVFVDVGTILIFVVATGVVAFIPHLKRAQAHAKYAWVAKHPRKREVSPYNRHLASSQFLKRSLEPDAGLRTVESSGGYRGSIFLSHVTEDQSDLILPLDSALARRGLSVWYDDYELRPGDSLPDTIEAGLARHTLGIVVLSPAFFARKWSQSELDKLAAYDKADKGQVLFIWHGVSKDDVRRYSSWLASKSAVPATSTTVDAVAELVTDALARPPAVRWKRDGDLSGLDPRDPSERAPYSRCFQRVSVAYAAAPGELKQPFSPEALNAAWPIQDAEHLGEEPARRRLYFSAQDALTVRAFSEKEGSATVHTATLKGLTTLLFPLGYAISAREAASRARQAGIALIVMDAEFDPTIPIAIVVDPAHVAKHVYNLVSRRAIIPKRRRPWLRRLDS